MDILPNAAARRLFLHLHGLAEPPAGPAKGAALGELIDRLGFVQIDSINTVERAHHMILFARRPTYRPENLKRLLERDRGLFEHWTHDASLIPMAHFGHWTHRFARDEAKLHANWKSWFRDGYEAKFDEILERITLQGAVMTSDVGEGEERGKGGWWDWHPSKTALEWLWRTGKLSIARREGFQKVYDLTERVIPAHFRTNVPERTESVDWACGSALERLGFATPGEIAAYWNAVTPAEAKAWCAEALRCGEVQEVAVEGADGQCRISLARPGVVDRAAALDPAPARLRVLSPFDPALRDRARAERLFGFHYRIEVFVPEAKRRFGYYVFPVLEGEALVGRIDMKAQRDRGCLQVRAFWPEAGVKLGRGRVERLAAELDRVARFAGCDRVGFDDGWRRETLADAAGDSGS